jgi:apolipoprotein D and lipocalin family protein
MVRAVLAAGLLALAACSAAGGRPVPEPAKPVALERYLGLWYEVARYPNSFEKGCFDVTAEYRRRDDGTISVTNTCREADGKVRQAQGRAKVVGAEGAKLKVSFFGPFYSDYWVLDRADDYSWALVGNSRGGLFWILAREPKPANQAELVRRAEALGYDSSRFVYPQRRATPG